MRVIFIGALSLWLYHPLWTTIANKMNRTFSDTQPALDEATEIAAPAPISVLVVDDHLLLAETVAATLSTVAAFRVDMVGDVEAALARIAKTGGYDVVLLDYSLPGTEGLAGLRQLMDQTGQRVAIFSGVATWPVVERAIALGAKGFIPKTLPVKSLEHAIRLIAEGETYIPFDYLQKVLMKEQPDASLKPRELRVLAFLCEGRQNKEIAHELGLNEVIVKADVKSICRKLGVRNRTEAALMARREGLC